MPLHRRHLIDIADFSRDEFDSVLETAVSMRQVLERPISRVPTLRGKSIVNVFFEASTRTRVWGRRIVFYVIHHIIALLLEQNVKQDLVSNDGNHFLFSVHNIMISIMPC